MSQDLADLGLEVVSENDAPDLVVINTCTVTQEATRSSRRAARRAVEDHPTSHVVLAGCYAVAEPEEASNIEGVDVVIGNDEKERIGEVISRAFGLQPRSALPLLQIGERPKRGRDRTRVNLKVQTGCDEFCTFCIIPFTRGGLRSYPLNDLLTEARRKVDEGARELVLTGVHLGKYGWDSGEPDIALVRLLEGLLEISGLARIRLSSILSRHLTDRIVALLAEQDRICRFLHVPLQAGDDEVLAAMNRPYRLADYLEAINRVTERVPGIGLSTDVIVGFPGETHAQFEKTMEVVERVGYLKLHVFRYSARPGTPSADYPGQVLEAEKRNRSKELIALGNDLRLGFHRRQLGLVREVFVEEAFENGDLSGHTDDFVRVRFAGPSSLAERLALVRVVEAKVESVRGEFLAEVPWSLARPRGTGVILGSEMRSSL